MAQIDSSLMIDVIKGHIDALAASFSLGGVTVNVDPATQTASINVQLGPKAPAP